MSRAVCGRAVVPTVMLCYFLSAFAALGLPPFFAVLLERLFGMPASPLAGWLYVLPTLVAAASAPL